MLQSSHCGAMAARRPLLLLALLCCCWALAAHPELAPSSDDPAGAPAGGPEEAPGAGGPEAPAPAAAPGDPLWQNSGMEKKPALLALPAAPFRVWLYSLIPGWQPRGAAGTCVCALVVLNQ